MKILEESKYRLICLSRKNMLFCSGCRLYVKKASCEKLLHIGEINVGRKYKIIKDIRMAQRLFRIEPRCGVFIDEDTAIISFHGDIYRISCKFKYIIKEHSFRKGMNHPLSFTIIENVNGFDNGVYYGEYFGNKNREPVHIYHRGIDGSWKIAYSFPQGSIQHIHGIFSHTQRNSIFVLTGDKDDESAIWECSNNFNQVIRVVGGTQKFRACVAFPYRQGIIYATDTPIRKNYLVYLNIVGDTIQLRKVCDISGPCIYGQKDKFGNMYFATSVEPDANIKPYIRYMVTKKLGDGVKDRYSRIYKVDPNLTVKIVYKEKKDRLPMLLFGFGTFLSPNGGGAKVYFTGQSIKNCDAHTISLGR